MAKYKLKFKNLTEISKNLNISSTLQKIIDMSLYPIVIFDKHGDMVYVNEPLKNLLEDIPIMPYNLFFEPGLAKLGIKNDLEKVLQGETVKAQDLQINLKKLHPENPEITLILNLTIFPLETSKMKSPISSPSLKTSRRSGQLKKNYPNQRGSMNICLKM